MVRERMSCLSNVCVCVCHHTNLIGTSSLGWPCDRWQCIVANQFCGSADFDEKHGLTHAISFDGPDAVCPDPRNPHGWYLAEMRQIRYFDAKKEHVTVIAGRESGFEMAQLTTEDGVGTAAEFDDILDIVIDSRGDTIWCADRHGGLRSIDAKSGRVTTTYHDPVYSVCWDRGTVEPDSALYCLTIGDGGQIRRSHIALNTMSEPIVTGRVQRFVVTPTGHLIFAKCVDDAKTGADLVHMFVLDTTNTGTGIERLDQLRDINRKERLLLLDGSRTLMTFTASGDFLTYTLPPQYFPNAKCCDRDL